METITAMAPASIDQVVWTRYAIHLLAMLAVFGPRRWNMLIATRKLPLQIIRSLLMLGLPLAFVAGIQRIGVAELMTVFWLFPLMSTALDRRTRRSWRQWTAAAVGFAGILLLEAPREPLMRLAAVLPFVMGLCFALYQRLTENLTGERDVTNVFHSALWVFLALTLRMPFVWQTPTVSGWLALSAIGLCSPLLLYLLDLVARRDGLSRVAPVMYLQLVFAVGLAMTFARERPHARAIAGSLLILVAATMASPRPAREPEAVPAAT